MATRRRPAGEWEMTVLAGLVGVWEWRLELALLAVAVVTQRLLAALIGDIGAAVLVAAIAGAVVAVGPVRRALWRGLRLARLRREWARAACDCGLAADRLHARRVLSARRVAAGDVLRVRVARGQSVAGLAARTGELAGCLRVREVRVEGDRSDGAIAWVTLVRRDPFDDRAPIAWPTAAVSRCHCGGRSRWASTSRASRYW